MRARGAGCHPVGRGRAHHQCVQFDNGADDAELCGLRRHQGRDGTTDALARGRTRAARYHGHVISPGPTETELFKAGKTDEEIRRFANASAFGRLGQPAEIADVVAFLASDAAGWVTGQNLRVNGGIAGANAFNLHSHIWAAMLNPV